MGIDFILEDLDCQPFLHGYWENCYDAELFIGIWYLPIKTLCRKGIRIKFYITKGNGLLLLGNEILHKSNLLNEQDILTIPPYVGNLSNERISIPTYSEPISLNIRDGMRTYLSIIPSKIRSFKSFLATRSSFITSFQMNDLQLAKNFAAKLHGFTHLPFKDMVTLCNRGGILTKTLKAQLKIAADSCSSCLSTGRPSKSRKVSFGRLLSSFNTHAQLDFLYVTELTPNPILHIVDQHTAFSSCCIVQSRDINDVVKSFEAFWIHIHGPPSIISGDPQGFRLNSSIRQYL